MQGQRAASSALGQPGKVNGATWLWTSMNIGVSNFQYSAAATINAQMKSAHDHGARDPWRNTTAESQTSFYVKPTALVVVAKSTTIARVNVGYLGIGAGQCQTMILILLAEPLTLF
jgi:hypothetical protein